MEELQRADPRARRKAVATIVLGAILGGAAVLLLEQSRDGIHGWLAADLTRAKIAILVCLIVVGFLPLLFGAIWAWRLGSRVIQEGRHPPEGLKVVRDVTILRGAQARGRGRVYRALGLLLLVAGGAMLWLSFRLSSLLSP